jgi:hypothetical protein
MARQKRRPTRTAPKSTADEAPIDVATIGQGVGTYETINGMPHGLVGVVVAVVALILIRPITRALKAFLRG